MPNRFVVPQPLHLNFLYRALFSSLITHCRQGFQLQIYSFMVAALDLVLTKRDMFSLFHNNTNLKLNFISVRQQITTEIYSF